MTLLFPGSFDPFTIGHKDIADRALQLCDHLIIAIGVNEAKTGMFSPIERKQNIEAIYSGNSRVEVITYSGLTADMAKVRNANIIKGIRSVKDFEYERDQADINRQLTGVDTLLLYAKPHLSAVSSSVVRELSHFGKDVSPYLP